MVKGEAVRMTDSFMMPSWWFAISVLHANVLPQTVTKACHYTPIVAMVKPFTSVGLYILELTRETKPKRFNPETKSNKS